MRDNARGALRRSNQWRTPTKRVGPIHDDADLPTWILYLEAAAPAGCIIIAIATLAIAAYAIGVDKLAGHL